MKISFVTNFCSHYRIRTFETLAKYYDIDYYFFSAGDEWYWQQQHGISKGTFHYKYLSGFRIGNIRITPQLPGILWDGNYDVYIKCINGRFVLPITYIIARLRRKPFILWTGIWTRLQTPIHRLLFPITRYFYHHADAIVVYGEHVKRYLISEGVPGDKVFVASHAVDNHAYNMTVSQAKKNEILEKLAIHQEKKVILYLGRLEPSKGLSYLLQAFASIKRRDTILLIAGAGGLGEDLKSEAVQLGINDSVRWAGYVPPDQAVYYYALASMMILPSISTINGKEPWGLVVNEAFNQKVPVITTESVGAAQGGLVVDGENGFVTPERDSAALAKAMLTLLDNEPLRQKMGNNAYEKISGWDNEKMVSGFREAIAFVTSKKKASRKITKLETRNQP